MRNYLPLLIILPVILVNAQINWEPVYKNRGSYQDRFFKAFPIPDTGNTYLFWTAFESSKFSNLGFRIRLKNGTFTSPRFLNNSTRIIEPGVPYSAQTSHDGKHILLAYNEYIQNYAHDNSNENYYANSYFIESTNGGESWTEPIAILETDINSNRYPINPVLLFEEDINRVTVGFILMNMNKPELGLAVRESGSTKFVQKTVNANAKEISLLNLAITVDKAKSKRYLHAIWFFSDTYLYYTRTDDDGRTWTPNKLLAKSTNTETQAGIMVSDYNAFENGLFIQYYSEKDIRLLSSNNHGELWMSTRVGSDFHGDHSICVCGYNGKGKIFSITGKTTIGSGYIRYQQPFQRFFTNAYYPFSGVDAIQAIHINCRYDRKGKYIVSALVLEKYTETIQLALGTMNEN